MKNLGKSWRLHDAPDLHLCVFAQVTPWLLLAPVGAIALGIAFWGDRPGPRLWIGGAMVLGGVLIIALRATQKLRPVAAPEEI